MRSDLKRLAALCCNFKNLMHQHKKSASSQNVPNYHWFNWRHLITCVNILKSFHAFKTFTNVTNISGHYYQWTVVLIKKKRGGICLNCYLQANENFKIPLPTYKTRKHIHTHIYFLRNVIFLGLVSYFAIIASRQINSQHNVCFTAELICFAQYSWASSWVTQSL